MCQCQGKGAGHQQHHHHQHHHHKPGHGGSCCCSPQEAAPQDELARLKAYAERLRSEVQVVEEKIKALENKG